MNRCQNPKCGKLFVGLRCSECGELSKPKRNGRGFTAAPRLLEKVEGTVGEKPAEPPAEKELSPQEALELSFTQLAEQYNQMGEQLKFMAPVVAMLRDGTPNEPKRFLYQGTFGVYFPTTDLTCFSNGKTGRGKPQSVLWLDTGKSAVPPETLPETAPNEPPAAAEGAAPS